MGNFHHGMALRLVANGGEGLKIRRSAAKDERGWSYSLWFR